MDNLGGASTAASMPSSALPASPTSAWIRCGPGWRAPRGRCAGRANFSIGAVLMMHFAAQAAAFYESVEIIELAPPEQG
jgi:hypothetical protein